MKSENKRTSILILVFPSKNAFLNKKKLKYTRKKANQTILELEEHLLKTARRNFL